MRVFDLFYTFEHLKRRYYKKLNYNSYKSITLQDDRTDPYSKYWKLYSGNH